MYTYWLMSFHWYRMRGGVHYGLGDLNVTNKQNIAYKLLQFTDYHLVLELLESSCLFQ
jgi:hypothetical protein